MLFYLFGKKKEKQAVVEPQKFHMQCHYECCGGEMYELLDSVFSEKELPTKIKELKTFVNKYKSCFETKETNTNNTDVIIAYDGKLPWLETTYAYIKKN